MKSIQKKFFVSAFALSCAVGVARADENLFGYVYGAETLPKGANEVYTWLTHRWDKGAGSYSAYDSAIEFEHGFTDNFQASLYLTGEYHNHKGAAPLEDTDGDGIGDTPEYPDKKGGGFSGVKVATKFNVLSPYKDFVGLAFYLEPAYATRFKITGQKMRQYSLETKMILQKNFFDDQLVAAYNFTLEFERRRFEGSTDWESEMEFEQTAGLSYRFAPKWFAGIEARRHTEFPELKKQEHAAWFIGPTLHYGDKKWWATLTWLPQITGKPRDPARSSQLHLAEHEKNEVRLKIGYNF